MIVARWKFRASSVPGSIGCPTSGFRALGLGGFGQDLGMYIVFVVIVAATAFQSWPLQSPLALQFAGATRPEPDVLEP